MPFIEPKRAPCGDWVIVIVAIVVLFAPVCWTLQAPARFGGPANAAATEVAAMATPRQFADDAMRAYSDVLLAATASRATSQADAAKVRRIGPVGDDRFGSALIS